MKHLVILFLCLVASNAAPAVDADAKDVENNQVDGESATINQNVQEKFIPTQDSREFSDLQTMEEIKEINVKCMEESGVEKQVLKDVIETTVLPKEDQKYRKFLGCLYRKQKYANDKGEIQYPKIKRFLSKYYQLEDLKVLDVCAELKQTENAGDNAFNVLECILPKLVHIKDYLDE